MSHLSSYSYAPRDVRVLLAGQTGGMPAPRRHGRDYATTAPTPADTSIFLTTLASQRLFGWRTSANWLPIEENEARLRLLQRFYTLVNADEVRRFLRVYPDAADVLIEARPHIERIFGSNTRVALEVTFDPDSESLRDSEELFGNIRTSLPVEEALDQLSQFDDEWFLAQLTRAGGRLNFNLEFV